MIQIIWSVEWALVLCYKTFDDVKKRKFKKELLKVENYSSNNDINKFIL